MSKSISSSGGFSSGTSVGTGIVGSTVAPSAYGVQYMPQPAAAQLQIQPMAQGRHTLLGFWLLLVGYLKFWMFAFCCMACSTCFSRLLHSCKSNRWVKVKKLCIVDMYLLLILQPTAAKALDQR